ncbi:MAG: T9SS type A sorting domain-containing protein [Gemmatimonadetes bacterium]|nr:T9SS type A sorting domain-containing protein [Gemmatimonadota bacterium]
MRRTFVPAVCAALVFFGPVFADELTTDDGKRANANPKARLLSVLNGGRSFLPNPAPSTEEGTLKGYGLSLEHVPSKYEMVDGRALRGDPLDAEGRERSLSSKATNFGEGKSSGKLTSGLNITGGRNAFAALMLEKVEDSSADEDLLKLHVSLARTKDLKGYGFSLLYDPAKYEFVKARELDENLLKSGAGRQTLFVSANHAPGRLDLGAVKVDGQGVSGDGKLVELIFKTEGAASSGDFRVSEGVLIGLDGAIDRLTNVDLDRLSSLPGEYELDQNVPNPFNPSTVIGYRIPEAGPVRLAIYNLLGQEVRVLVDLYMEAGSFTATWDGKDEMGRQVSSGIYLYRIQAGGFSASRRMLFLK